MSLAGHFEHPPLVSVMRRTVSDNNSLPTGLECKTWKYDHGESMAMITGPHFSKPDPKNLQWKVLQQYEYKVRQLLEANGSKPARKPVSL